MKPFPHYYSAQLTGGPFAYGDLTAAGVPALRTAPRGLVASQRAQRRPLNRDLDQRRNPA
jgi:hypothetical protein